MENNILHKIRIVFIPLFLLISLNSCDSKFTSLKQAKNAVNKNGFREGRWVDFYDSSKGIVTDTSEGYDCYILSEYTEGRMRGEMHFFSANHVKVQILTPILEQEKLIEKNIELIPSFQVRTTLDSDGNQVMVERYNEEFMLLSAHKNLSSNSSLILENKYKEKSLEQTDYYMKIGEKTNKRVVIKYSLDSSFIKTLDNEIILNISKKIKEIIKGDSILERIIFSYENPFSEQNDFSNLYKQHNSIKSPVGVKELTVKSIYLNSDTVNLMPIFIEIRNDYYERKRIERQERINRENRRVQALWEEYRSLIRSRTNNRPSDNSSSRGYSKTCGWCNRTFRGDHYTHVGRMADCYSTSSYNTINKFCSMKCCSESRRRGG
jgi:hypothetical protein